MSLMIIAETIKMMQEENIILSKEDKDYVLKYAFITGDMEKTKSLIKELSADDADAKAIKERYEEERHHKPEWVESIENLAYALEMYRLEEEKTLKQIAEYLKMNGIEVKEDSLKDTETEDIKKMLDEVKDQNEPEIDVTPEAVR